MFPWAEVAAQPPQPQTSTAIWVALLTLVITNVLQLVKQWLDGKQRMEEADRVEKAALAAKEAAREVKADLEKSTAVTDAKLEKVKEVMEAVHSATNGIKDELVSEVRKAATLQGEKDERERLKGEGK